MDRYEKLANAIILQAVKDYRDALKTGVGKCREIRSRAVLPFQLVHRLDLC